MLQEIANEVLEEVYDDPSTFPRIVSDMWPARFFKVHPEYFIRSFKVLVKDRGAVVIPKLIIKYFTKFNDAKRKYNILDDDMWNFDETGFQIGVGGL